MSEAAPGETATPTGWATARAIGVVLATVTAVPYALIVMVLPFDLIVSTMLGNHVDASGVSLPRFLTTATATALTAAVLAAGAIGRRTPPWLVLLVGVAAFAVAARWAQSTDSLSQLTVVRALQGLGAGAVLAATPALTATFGPRPRILLGGVFAAALTLATAITPWAAFRLPFVDVNGWRQVAAPYPWLLAVAFVAAVVVALATIAPHQPTPTPEPVDQRADRLGWPLLIPALIGTAALLIKPQWQSLGSLVTLLSLLLATLLLVTALGGILLSTTTGNWRPGATAPVIAAAALVLPVTGADAFNKAIATDQTWPLADRYVLPALGGATLAGILAVVIAATRPEHQQRRLVRAGLLVAVVGAAVPIVDNTATTAVGAIVTWAGVGLALGATLRGTGVAAAAWAGAAFAVGCTLAINDSNTIRNVLLQRALGSTSDPNAVGQAARDSNVTGGRIWIAVSVVVLALVALLVTRFPRHRPAVVDPAVPDRTDTADVADAEDGPDTGPADPVGERGPEPAEVTVTEVAEQHQS